MSLDLNMLRAEGNLVIEREGAHDYEPLPLLPWSDFPLRFSAEYAVSDFAAEAGFWASLFGFKFLGLDDGYAIVTDDRNTYTFAFREDKDAGTLTGLRLLWFTDALNDAGAFLEKRDIPFEILYQSPQQRYIRTKTPAGVIVEIWSGLEDHCPS